jgi:hypothetical protein
MTSLISDLDLEGQINEYCLIFATIGYNLFIFE